MYPSSHKYQCLDGIFFRDQFEIHSDQQPLVIWFCLFCVFASGIDNDLERIDWVLANFANLELFTKQTSQAATFNLYTTF